MVILEEGQPPPSTFPPVVHAGSTGGPEWDAPAHGTMHSGIGAEETKFSDGGGEGGHRQGFQRLWAPPRDGDLLKYLLQVILAT